MIDKKKQKFTGRGAELLRALANQGLRIFSLEQARAVGQTLQHLLRVMNILHRSQPIPP